MKLAGWIAACVLAALLYRNLYPKTVVEYVSGPPAKPDTVYVTELQTVLDTVFRDRIREVVTTDTVNIVHEVVISDTVRLGDTLRPRWYVNDLYVPDTPGDTALASLSMLGVDQGAAWRVDALQRIWVPGPLRSLRADEYGLQLDFYPAPRTRTCSVWCRLQWALGGAAAGLIIGGAL